SVGSRGVGSGDAKPVGRNAHGPSALRSFGFWEQWRGTTITGRKEKDRGHSCPRGATRGVETAWGLAVLGRVMSNPWAGMPTVLRSFGFWAQWRGATITGRKEKDRGHSCPRGANVGCRNSAGSRGVGSGDVKPVGRNAHGPSVFLIPHSFLNARPGRRT